MATENTALPAANGEPKSTNVVALPARPEPATPSEKALSFVKRHPVMTVAGGVALGFAISTLVPRSFGRKLAKRAYRAAEAGAAAALSLGEETIDKVEDGGAFARRKAGVLADRAERLGEKAAARAEKLGVAALGTASAWGHTAAERAEHLGHAAAERAEDLGGRASHRLSQFGDKALVQSSKLIGYPKPPASVADRIMAKAHGLKARVRG